MNGTKYTKRALILAITLIPLWVAFNIGKHVATACQVNNLSNFGGFGGTASANACSGQEAITGLIELVLGVVLLGACYYGVQAVRHVGR
jgi:hypothetical protein